jgi:hypothetical protein
MKGEKISRQTAVDSIAILKRSGLNKVGERKLSLTLEYLMQQIDELKKGIPEKRSPGRPPKKPNDIREESD